MFFLNNNRKCATAEIRIRARNDGTEGIPVPETATGMEGNPLPPIPAISRCGRESLIPERPGGYTSLAVFTRELLSLIVHSSTAGSLSTFPTAPAMKLLSVTILAGVTPVKLVSANAGTPAINT
jgi:hypothetical protein